MALEEGTGLFLVGGLFCENVARVADGEGERD